MGPTCSRRKSAEQQPHPDEGGGSANDNCCLTELPKDVIAEPPWHQLQGSPRALTHIACPAIAKNRGRWIRAVLKFRLIRQFRIRWHRAGEWLHHKHRGAAIAPPEQKAIVLRLWEEEGRAILKRHDTRQLFSPKYWSDPSSRLTTNSYLERARFSEIVDSLRAKLDHK